MEVHKAPMSKWLGWMVFEVGNTSGQVLRTDMQQGKQAVELPKTNAVAGLSKWKVHVTGRLVG